MTVTVAEGGPAVGMVTALVWSRLPEVYRHADAAQSPPWPLLRFLAGALDGADAVEELRGRFTYTPGDDGPAVDHGLIGGLGDPWASYGSGYYGDGSFGGVDTSDLVDPLAADASWLPWLTQLVGLDRAGLTVQQVRDRAADPPALVWNHSTPPAIVRAVRDGIGSPTADVQVVPSWGGDPWVIAVGTDWGVQPTRWADINGPWSTVGPTWADISPDVTAVLVAAERERPAGFRIIQVNIGDLP